MIKKRLRKVARKMASWPILGRIVRIGVAMIRLSDINYGHNHWQLSSCKEQENLVKSVPVALRNITRELIEIRDQLENISNSTDYPRCSKKHKDLIRK